MKPFDQYPEDDSTRLPQIRGANARRGYGLELMRLTNQTHCAYCEISLADDFYRWLLLSVDHVIPRAEYKRLGIPIEWGESYSNSVLCCLGCNGFDNRYRIRWQETSSDWTVERFFQLRNKVFADRKARILNLMAKERQFFLSLPWNKD